MSLTFHNNRWPLLTDLLLEAGWKRAAAGTTADLSFVDDGKWQNEETTKLNGKVKFFSRMFTDLLANKRSCAISLRADGCIPEVMPPTFTEFKEWEAAVTCNHDTQNPLPIWFFKKVCSMYSSILHFSNLYYLAAVTNFLQFILSNFSFMSSLCYYTSTIFINHLHRTLSKKKKDEQ